MERPITFYSPEIGGHMKIDVDVRVNKTPEPGIVEIVIPEATMRIPEEWAKVRAYK